MTSTNPLRRAMRSLAASERCAAASRHVNTLTRGPAGYSLCARWYVAHKRGRKWATYVVLFVDDITQDDKHCYNAWLTCALVRYGGEQRLFIRGTYHE